MSEDYYKLKYLKYKKKYLDLKGGTIPPQCNHGAKINVNDPNYRTISDEQATLRNECAKCYQDCHDICSKDKNKCITCAKNKSCPVYFNPATGRYERTWSNTLSLGLLN